MAKRDRDKVKALIHTLGLKYCLSDHIIKEIVDSPYLFSADIIKNLDISHIKTEEELEETKTNFLYKSFGRLYISFPTIDRKNKQREVMINLNKKRWKK